MLETYFSAAKMLGHLRSGPSGPYLDGFAAALERQGYGPETAVRYLRAAAHIGHVMAEQGAGLTDVDLAAFGEHLRTCRCPRAKGGRRNHHTIYGARLFRRHLVELGLCRSAAVGAAPAEPQLVADFKTWLRKHRGASDATVRLYARDATGLMMELRSDPAGWRPNDVRSYFLERASNSGSGTIEKMTTSLRAFLRYLAVAGRCQAGLDGAVPAYAHWQLADMPRYLSTEQVDRLIAACDGDFGGRRRDRAIVLLLVRLGLRAGDVAQLRLADIEWQTGSLRVCGKSRYEVRLPLPQDVGDAIAAYLECRPSTRRNDPLFTGPRSDRPSRNAMHGSEPSVASYAMSRWRTSGTSCRRQITSAPARSVARRTSTRQTRSVGWSKLRCGFSQRAACARTRKRP
ncbi:tyrosine-type recombinase/integrase [Mesorhizobium sp. BAC0120]|uniref:tyrosine-type recombinase/integrase n=1 Tax=Mesorhizobium sp. BAC0120 TaxID=3090670 RepID=UPI00298CC628|nr:tyrosine-type recombinase/integrase [Mesorhizobium sp. BAC0120]MDW6022173.1 tyrosine-type recombinase/integrase [Mesorhizobium sp. BAC0120]MDW6022205.1 tyrosine-type recombinase/integrase [Mesorhizobium sp. BAC0120]